MTLAQSRGVFLGGGPLLVDTKVVEGFVKNGALSPHCYVHVYIRCLVVFSEKGMVCLQDEGLFFGRGLFILLAYVYIVLFVVGWVFHIRLSWVRVLLAWTVGVCLSSLALSYSPINARVDLVDQIGIATVYAFILMGLQSIMASLALFVIGVSLFFPVVQSMSAGIIYGMDKMYIFQISSWPPALQMEVSYGIIIALMFLVSILANRITDSELFELIAINTILTAFFIVSSRMAWIYAHSEATRMEFCCDYNDTGNLDGATCPVTSVWYIWILFGTLWLLRSVLIWVKRCRKAKRKEDKATLKTLLKVVKGKHEARRDSF